MAEYEYTWVLQSPIFALISKTRKNINVFSGSYHHPDLRWFSSITANPLKEALWLYKLE